MYPALTFVFCRGGELKPSTHQTLSLEVIPVCFHLMRQYRHDLRTWWTFSRSTLFKRELFEWLAKAFGVVLPSKRLYKLFIVPGNHISFFFFLSHDGTELSLSLGPVSEQEENTSHVKVDPKSAGREVISSHNCKVNSSRVHVFVLCICAPVWSRHITLPVMTALLRPYCVAVHKSTSYIFFFFFLHKSRCFQSCTIRQYCCSSLRTCCAKSID